MKKRAERMLAVSVRYVNGAAKGLEGLDDGRLTTDDEKCQALKSVASCLRTAADRIDQAVAVQKDDKTA